MLLILLGISCSDSYRQETTNELEVILLPSPVQSNASLPYLVTGADDKLYLSWIDTHEDSASLNYSQWDGQNWDPPEQISQGTDWFVNWADYPMISVSKDGSKLAHFLAKSTSGDYSYDINVTGTTLAQPWGSSFIPHLDGTPTEHGFVSMIPLSDSTFQLAWLDGRNTSSQGHEHHGAMTLRTAITDIAGNLQEAVELDSRVCDCCQTTGILTSQGPVVFYRDRSENEIRDIAMVRKVNGNWASPQIINEDQWEIAGCPVNGPRASALGNNLVVAWFTAAQGRPQIKVLFSVDAGEQFGQVIQIDDPNPLGRVDVELLDDNKALVSWLSKQGDQAMIKAQIVHQSGAMEAPMVIANSSELRASGFPQMAQHQGIIYFAWTQILDENQAEIKVVKLNLPSAN